MKENEMRQIGRLIAEIIHAPESEEVRGKVQQRVTELAARFPLYAKRLKHEAAEAGNVGR
jgi:glycine/serine hydroxymethyltransferase